MKYSLMFACEDVFTSSSCFSNTWKERKERTLLLYINQVLKLKYRPNYQQKKKND